MPVTFCILVALAVASGYAAGRLHQWYRQALERDLAWRDGYNQASGALFKMAARLSRRSPGEHTTGDVARRRSRGAVSGSASVTDIADAPSAGRHSFDLRHQVTRRLGPGVPGAPKERTG